jgi:hypothetical protein
VSYHCCEQNNYHHLCRKELSILDKKDNAIPLSKDNEQRIPWFDCEHHFSWHTNQDKNWHNEERTDSKTDRFSLESLCSFMITASALYNSTSAFILGARRFQKITETLLFKINIGMGIYLA